MAFPAASCRLGLAVPHRRQGRPARSYRKSPAGNRLRGNIASAFARAAVWISRRTVAVRGTSTMILPRPVKVTPSPGASTESSRRPLAVTHSLPVTQEMRHALPLSEASSPRARTSVDGFIASHLRICLSSWDQESKYGGTKPPGSCWPDYSGRAGVTEIGPPAPTGASHIRPCKLTVRSLSTLRRGGRRLTNEARFRSTTPLAGIVVQNDLVKHDNRPRTSSKGP